MLEGIKRGRLTDAEKAEIERLAIELQKPTPSRIARKLNRHPATINWHMICNGLINRKLKYIKRATGRRSNGSAVHCFDAKQDARLVALRLAGKTYREIGEILTVEFGIPRTGHAAQVRHRMLSAYDGGPEDIAA